MARPTSYLEAYAPQAYRLCLLGATDKEVAEFFGVTERTVNQWKRSYPEFLQSLKRGKEDADANVAKSLYRRALGYSHPAVKIFWDPKTDTEKVIPYTERYAPDTTACIFWLKNRRPAEWRDRVPEAAAADSNEVARQVREALRAMLAADGLNAA